MEDTFFSNRWNQNYYQPRQPYSWPKPRMTTAPPSSSKPKVVSIPVNFVGSERKAASPSVTTANPSRPTAAALRIQRVARGFLVRKNLRLVREVSAEVDEIERMMKAKEEAMRVDEKERVRVSEMLMASLFRLDSARGVRDYRKKVIRRAIMLQEKVDSIASSQDQPLETPEPVEVTGDEEMKPAEALNTEIGAEELIPVKASSKRDAEDEYMEEETLSTEILEAGSKNDANEESMEETLVSMNEGDKPNVPATDQISVEANAGGLSVDPMEEALEDKGIKPAAEGMKEAMERVMKENQRLQVLMAELCQRSEQQCRLIGSLAGRVGLLEQVVQRMEQRKKTKHCSARKQL